LGRPEQGLAMAEESVAILRQSSRKGDLVIPLLVLNMNAVFINKIAVVGQDGQEALEFARARGDSWREAMMLTWLASRALVDQDYGLANLLAQQSSTIFEKLGESWGLTWSSGVVLGSVAVEQGDYAEAIKRYQHGLNAAQEIDYRRAIQYAYNNLGHVALLMGDPLEAVRCYLLSLRISEEIGQTREMVETLFDIARARVAQGKNEEAIWLTTLVLSQPAITQQSLFGNRHLQEEAKLLRKKLEDDLTNEGCKTIPSKDRSIDFDAEVSNLLHPEQEHQS